ncbi:hypothetical protein BDW02DRAFT_634356 [Decorospora gaudefroyi]|uniref:C2H2-type domain-containing protein n=1 Tax=Decorospora gaudefroyi TaxID=184978 RepID=A0A6A5K0H5_9PLEO|nr:hypothetical protein BDW02DRAFT_634356 [Decorospora gaudefroyi]
MEPKVEIGERQGRADQSAAASNPAALTSSRSDVPEPSQEDDGRVESGAPPRDGTDASTDGDESNKLFMCQHCNRTYDSKASLSRHQREKRSKCAKDRGEGEDSATIWACSRCRAHMAKKFSAERHINDACWKICDECCEAGNATCNAYYSTGDCDYCKEQGLSCTKHNSAVKDSTAECLTVAAALRDKPAPKSRAITTSTPKRDKGKRKAAVSPESGPELKSLKFSSNILRQRGLRDDISATPPSLRKASGRAPPPRLDLAHLQRPPQDSLAVPLTGVMLDRQAIESATFEEQQCLYNIALRKMGISPRGSGPGYFAASPGHKTSSPANGWLPDSNDTHPVESRLNWPQPAQTAEFRIHEDSSVRPGEYLASALESRFSTRQTTAESVGDERAAHLTPPIEQVQDMDGTSRSVLEESVARETLQAVILHSAPSRVADEKDPTFRIQIHSNIYDSYGTRIVYILTIRASQKFGPRLDAYCRHRNKEYGVDWDFVYRYSLGGPNDGKEEKVISITYDMTPEDVHDEENPRIKIRDMDTIVVMKAKSRLAAMAENDTALSPPGSPVSVEIVDINNGETPVYQDAIRIQKWQQACEGKIMELEAYTAELQSLVSDQREKLELQEMTIADLETRNMKLMTDELRASRALPLRQSYAHLGHLFPGSAHAASSSSASTRIPDRHEFMARLQAARDPREHTMPRQQAKPVKFPVFSHNQHQPERARNFDVDGLPLFHGQDNPPLLDRHSMGYRGNTGSLRRGTDTSDFPHQHPMSQLMRRQGPVRDAGAELEVRKFGDRDEKMYNK